ncbi:MAG TPA: PHP domain-containing protein [Terriglobales bacterium]|nr:PHP domain-containing protein [Terriglobales bacterium]
MLKGALHVHSTYSDGEFTVAELRKIYLDEGCSFVCITDHADYFDDSSSLRAYVQECEMQSDNQLRFVPGLEYSCDRRMHILGYGATQLTDATDPEEVIRHIDAQGAVSVIAHPKDEFFEWIEGFQVLPQGIEGWNSKYDGRYAPRPGTFALIQRLQKRRPSMYAFYGQDLHWKKQFRGLFVEAECDSNSPAQILQALAHGAFRGQKGELTLPSSAMISEQLIAEFAKDHDRSYSMWRFLKNAKGALDRLGIPVPQSLKAHLRRIF